MTKWTLDIAELTRPWVDHEYMVVDGMKVVYTVDQKTGDRKSVV